jgi:AcrR family transcriptional regulator
MPTGAPPDPPPTRRLTPKGNATRSRLLALATDLFDQDGYSTASVRELAHRSGLSTGAIYGLFRGKSELLEAVVDDCFTSEIEMPALAMNFGLADIDAQQYAIYQTRARLRSLLLEGAVAAKSDDSLRQRLHALVGGRLESWTRAHEEAQAEGGFTTEVDMAALVTLLVSADLGLGVLAALDIDLPDPTAWSGLLRRMIGALVPADDQITRNSDA